MHGYMSHFNFTILYLEYTGYGLLDPPSLLYPLPDGKRYIVFASDIIDKTLVCDDTDMRVD